MMSGDIYNIAIVHPAGFDNIQKIKKRFEKEDYRYSVLLCSVGSKRSTRNKDREKIVIIIDESFLQHQADLMYYYKANQTLVLLFDGVQLPDGANVKKDEVKRMDNFKVSELVPIIIKYFEQKHKKAEIDDKNKSKVDRTESSDDSSFSEKGTTPQEISPRKTANTPKVPSPKRERITQASDIPTSEGFNVNPFLFVLVPILAIALVYIGTVTSREIVNEQNLSLIERFENRIEELKLAHRQEPKLWKIVKSSMKRHIIDSDPQQPAVLMVVSSKKAATKREALAGELAKVYSLRCNKSQHITVVSDDYQDLGHAAAKEKLDGEISTGFYSGACASVISNFEKLPPASTTVFYQFCENDFAPFTKVAIIFTLEISHGPWDTDNQFSMLKQGDTPSPKFWDRIVDAFLYHSLQHRDGSTIMKVDMISGLLTRITPSVIWVE